MGLSPRVRGNQVESSRITPISTVYPRVCGGTDTVGRRYRCGHLSRSIPACAGEPISHALTVVIATIRADGSIPACAGEPGQRARRAGLSGVYPRVCGGTQSASSQYILPMNGSIPACAGEPAPDSLPDTTVGAKRVYPRVCGGTLAQIVHASRQALSVYPRVCGGTQAQAMATYLE